jgi:hypothetical protein
MMTSNGHNGVHHEADEAIDLLYSWMPPQQAPQPCPEALFSCTMEGCIDGHKTLVTARGQTAAEFKANLEAIKGVLDPVPGRTQGPTQAASQGEGQDGWCAVHGLQMKENVKDGRRWWSHRTTDGTWCKGR